MTDRNFSFSDSCFCLTLSWRGPHHIETSPLICRANQRIGFYMIETSIMKELINKWVFDRKSIRILPRRCIHKPVKNLRWSFLQKQLTALTIFAKRPILNVWLCYIDQILSSKSCCYKNRKVSGTKVSRIWQDKWFFHKYILKIFHFR